MFVRAHASALPKAATAIDSLRISSSTFELQAAEGGR